MLQDLTDNFLISPEKSTIIRNPVDCQRVWLNSKTDREFFSKGEFQILAAGKLMYQKGFDSLIKAMAKIEDTEFKLTILGEGQEKNNLEQLILELRLSKQVNLKGFVKNPYRYMVNADLFVLSSRFEGFPNVVLESLACGTPVVAFNCPGDVCDIIHDGTNGWLVEPGNIDALAKTIKKATKTEWDSALIRKSCEERFGAGTIIAQYENLFLRLCAETEKPLL